MCACCDSDSVHRRSALRHSAYPAPVHSHDAGTMHRPPPASYFLTWAVLPLALPLCTRPGAMASEGDAPPAGTAEVLVLGCGVAGLSAALAALEAGIRSITILEARDRVGGRVAAWQPSSTPETSPSVLPCHGFDIGAAWIRTCQGGFRGHASASSIRTPSSLPSPVASFRWNRGQPAAGVASISAAICRAPLCQSRARCLHGAGAV